MPNKEELQSWMSVHDEPDCLGYNKCKYQEAHKHGFACDKSCNECWGRCHPNCPANAKGQEMVNEEAVKIHPNEGLWAEAWTPLVMEGEELSLETLVSQAIGAASMCWSEPPTGIFNSERATWVLGGVINELEKLAWREKYMAEADEKEDGCVEAAIEKSYNAEFEAQMNIRKQDTSDLVAWILHYKNPASDEEKLRQIRIVME